MLRRINKSIRMARAPKRGAARPKRTRRRGPFRFRRNQSRARAPEPDPSLYDPYTLYILEGTRVPPRNRSRTYVGITNNLAKRLRQHNGELAGGARSTHSGRPWKLCAIVEGFRNKTVALRFEWSMHHPRIRKLVPPLYTTEGRIHCARQLIQRSLTTSSPPLSLTLTLIDSAAHFEGCVSAVATTSDAADGSQ